MKRPRHPKLVERGQYWYQKTKYHFHVCFGMFSYDKVRYACVENVENEEEQYDACRECKETTAEYEFSDLDTILGIYGGRLGDRE